MNYEIINNMWYCPYSNYSTDLLGVCISIDTPEYYKDFVNYHNIKSPIITLLKHGDKQKVKDYYLTCVDSPLRQYCAFKYVELFPNNINCENINKIISTSCLPVKYLNKLIDENKNLTNV